ENMRRHDTWFNTAAGYGALVGVVRVIENTALLGYDLGRAAFYSDFKENSFADLVTAFQNEGAAAIPKGIAGQVEQVVQGNYVAFGELAFSAYAAAEGASNLKISTTNFNLPIPPILSEALATETVQVSVPVVAGAGGLVRGGGVLLAESLESGGQGKADPKK